MAEQQLDLFAGAGGTPAGPLSTEAVARTPPADYGDEALVAAIPLSGLADGPGLAAAAGRRRLAAAVPALERWCRRFAGFGCERELPEQVAALEALATIGGRPAAEAVARLVGRGAVLGLTLRTALAAARELEADLPAELLLALLRDPDPRLRAGACRCLRHLPAAVPVLLDLLRDLHHAEVRAAAACALGRMGRAEARPALLRLLADTPSPEVIEALVEVADEDSVVLLGRLARERPDLAGAVLDALEAIDGPAAERVARAVRAAPAG